MAKLTFVLEDGQEVVVPIAERITIGRDEDNDVVVDDERISAHHAELLQNADGSIQVFDLNSAAGTFVNGEREQSLTLLHGDKLAFGPLTAVLDLEDPATAAPPPAAAAVPDSLSDAIESSAASPDAVQQETAAPLAAETARLEARKTQLQAAVDAAEKELRDWQQRSEKERAMHSARVESLRAEEERLAPFKAAVQDAEAAHHDWLEAIQVLSSQHEEKTTALERLNTQHYEKSTEVQRLASDAAAAQQEIESAAEKKTAELARLQQVRDECEQDEKLLNTLRQQVIEMETRLKEGQERAADREEQVKSTEKKIEQLNQLAQNLTRIEAHIEELSGSEEKLMQAHARHQETEAEHAALATAVAALGVEQQRHETALSRLQTDLVAREQDLAARSAALTAETRRLEETQARRTALEAQCQELADTQQKLADTRQRLAAVEQRYRSVQANAAEGGVQAAPKRSAAPTGSMPKLAPAVESTSTAPQEDLGGKIEIARRELAGLEARIAALRTQEQAMGVPVAPTPVSATAAEAPATGIPPPQIVHVDSVRLTAIPMKSERYRKLGADPAPAAAPQEAGVPIAPRPKAKKTK